MTRHTTDDIDDALRSLDAAGEFSLSEGERLRAEDTFARIVASVEDVSPAAAPARSRRRRLIPLGAIVGAGAVTTALMLSGGSAFASWTAQPEPLPLAKAAAAADTCRAKLDVPENSNETLLAERRGGWTYVFISSPAGEATCLMQNTVVGKDPDGQEIFADLAEPTPPAAVDPRGIVETGSTAASTDTGLFRKGYLTWTYGYAGAEVKAVTVRTPLGDDVEATVENGRFAAWWPSERPSSKNPDVMGAWQYTVTLDDGSVVSVDS